MKFFAVLPPAGTPDQVGRGPETEDLATASATHAQHQGQHINFFMGFLREGGFKGVCNPRFPKTPHYSVMLPKLP